MPLTKPTLIELETRIRSDILTRVTPGTGALRYALLKIYAKVWAAATYLLWGAIEFLSKMAFPQTAINTDQTSFLALIGNKWIGDKLQPTTAAGNVVFTGVDTTLVPSGTTVQDPDGKKYDTQANATITGGSATAAVISQESGEAQNQAPGTGLTLVSPITDIDDDATVDADGLTGGTDLETDEDYRERIINRIQNPPMGGSENDYIRWAKEALSTITRVWIYPDYTQPSEVGVFFVKDNDPLNIIPTGGDLTTVDTYLNDPDRKPVIAKPKSYAPTKGVTDFTIRIKPFRQDVQDQIEASLQAMILRDSEPGGRLLISKIREAISVSTGEEDHVIDGIDINSNPQDPEADLIYSGGEIAVYGTTVFSELL